MSLFIEMLLLLIGAGLIGMLLGWILHGKCERDDDVLDHEYHDNKGAM